MKQGLSFMMALLLIQAHAQDSSDLKKRIFKVKVLTVSGQSLTGYLNKIADSTLILSPQKLYFNPYNSTTEYNYTPVTFSNITEVQIRRKGAVVRGMLKGIIIGAATGVVTGFLLGDDKGVNDNSTWCILCTTAGEKAVIGGTTGGILGGITGAIIGAVARKRFLIARQKKEFDKMRLTMIEKISRVPLE
ncbi:MAG: hypothetical protein J7621_23770 [Niastella sp.]|nr:hypothetical protein [Niastella sp.]